MNRDQLKSKLFREKKRQEVEDGIADIDRGDRAREKGVELKNLVSHDLIKFPENDNSITVRTMLDIIARKRGFVPITDNFIARLGPHSNSITGSRSLLNTSPDATETAADWLKRFIISPYTTSPEHPALERCIRKESDNSTTRDLNYQVYLRTYKTTAKNERALLGEFLKRYPQYTVSLEAKLRSLDDVEDNAIVWGHYIGQTIATDPIGRYEEDLAAAPVATTMLKKWMDFTSTSSERVTSASLESVTSTSLEWEIYEFQPFHTHLTNSLGAPSDVWRARPDLQELEYGLILAADKRGWNSAPGGLPQVCYSTPTELREVLNSIGHLLNLSPLNVETYPKLPLIRTHFQNHYNMGAAQLNRAVNQACDFSNTDGTTRLLLVGSRVTRRDGKGDSDWWHNAGPACVLWRLSYDAVTATTSNHDIISNWQYDQKSLAAYGGFVDLWPVLPPETFETDSQAVAAYSEACTRLNQLIRILRPRVICFMSREVCSLLDAGALIGTTRIWEEAEESEFGLGMIESSGSIKVQKIGEHYCVAVTQPHPGFFAYDPSLQPVLYPLFICCSAIVRLAKDYANNSLTWGEKEAQLIADQVNGQKAKGLDRYMDGLKQQIRSIISVSRSISQLSRPRTVEEFDAHSRASQAVRQDYVDRDIVALGKAWSTERVKQVQSLSNVPGTIEQLCTIPEGKRLHISIHSRNSRSELTAAAIEKARSVVDLPARIQNRRNTVAGSGLWPGFSGNNPTVREALEWISSAPSTAKRTSAKDPESLLHCRCPECGMIGLVRMNTRLHFCAVAPSEPSTSASAPTYAKGISLVASGSKVEFYKVVIPVMLYYSSDIRAEMDAILEQNSTDYRVRRNEAGQVISIVKKEASAPDFDPAVTSWETFQVGMWAQVQEYHSLGWDWIKSMNRLDIEFQKYIKGLGSDEEI